MSSHHHQNRVLRVSGVDQAANLLLQCNSESSLRRVRVVVGVKVVDCEAGAFPTPGHADRHAEADDNGLTERTALIMCWYQRKLLGNKQTNKQTNKNPRKKKNSDDFTC